MTTKNCANGPKLVLKDLCENSCAKCPVTVTEMKTYVKLQ